MEPTRWDDESVDIDEVLEDDADAVVEDVVTEPALEVDPADWVDQHIPVPVDDSYDR